MLTRSVTEEHLLKDVDDLRAFLEISDIETLPTEQVAEKVKRAIDEGTSGSGRGFVLMPSAWPYGRLLSPLTMKNYAKMIEIIEDL